MADPPKKMAHDGKVDPQLGWIYEGTKSLVNREDYLLGKRLDKNFELYSDTVIKEKEGGIDALIEARARQQEASNSRVSNLCVNVVRNEDPLVAIKVQEEKIRQEKLENPLIMLKIQKVLKEAMEKKARKMLKKKAKQAGKDRKRSVSSSRSADKEHNHSHKHKEHHKKHHHKHHKTSELKEKKRKRHSTNSDDDDDDGDDGTSEVKSGRKRRPSSGVTSGDDNGDENQAQATTSNSSGGKTSQESSTRKRRQLDSHIPEHLRPKYDDDASSSSETDTPKRPTDGKDDSEKRSHIRAFGLVRAKNKPKDDDVGDGSKQKTSNPYELARFKPTIEPYKKEERRKLTAEEMEAKRLEMMKNAEWRNATRCKNIDRAKRYDEAERREERSKAANFIKPMLNTAAASMTVEQQLSSHRQGLQRSHGYMEEKFAVRR